MRTAIATHELLPEALDLESLSIEAGRVSTSVSSGARRCLCPVCGRGSSRVHSRYSRAISDLPWHGISVSPAERAPEGEALLLPGFQQVLGNQGRVEASASLVESFSADADQDEAMFITLMVRLTWKVL